MVAIDNFTDSYFWYILIFGFWYSELIAAIGAFRPAISLPIHCESPNRTEFEPIFSIIRISITKPNSIDQFDLISLITGPLTN